MYYNPIDRFLADAESAARAGDYGRTFELLLLALDTEPGDLSVLSRAQAVRKLLPAQVTTPGIEVRGRPTVAPVLVPIGEQIIVEDDEEDMAEMLRRVRSAGVPDRGGGLAARSRHVEKPAMTQQPGRTAAARSGRLLWIALVPGLVLAGLALASPGRLGGLLDHVAGARDPLARAERLVERGRPQEASPLLEMLTRDGSPEARAWAHFLLGRIAMEQGDAEGARVHLVRGLANERDWRRSLEAADLLDAAGFATDAATAYRLGFDNGAPIERWSAIAAGLRRAGDEGGARNIESSLERISQ
jgi:hypothetical protein